MRMPGLSAEKMRSLPFFCEEIVNEQGLSVDKKGYFE